MSSREKTDGLEAQYLLGSVSEQQRTAVEEDLFTNDSTFEALELAEDDLIDRFVRDQLSSAEHHRIQTLVTQSPRLAERVKFARVLASRADAFATEEALGGSAALHVPSPRQSRRWWSALFPAPPAFGTAGAVFALLFLVAAVSLIGWFRVRNEAARLAAERTNLEQQNKELAEKTSALQKQTAELTSTVEQQRQQHNEDQKRIEELNRRQPAEIAPTIFGTIVPLLLSPGGTRGSNSQAEVKLGRGTAAVQVTLALENADYARYNLRVRAAGGSVFLTRKGLKPRNKSLAVTIPSSQLSPNDYLIHVDGVTDSHRIEGVNDYSFRILR